MYSYNKYRFQILCLVFAVLGIYYPAIFSPLLSVDDLEMYNLLLNIESVNLSDVFLPGSSSGYYRPILFLSFMMDKFVWGLEESFMHLENIIFHLTNSLLVYAITRQTTNQFPAASPIAAFVAALLFAVHPLNTEAVNWISGRTDLLAGFFLLFAMYLLTFRPLSLLQSFIAAIFVLLACLAKETAVFFLPAAMILPFYIFETGLFVTPLLSVFRRYWFHFIVFFMTGVVYLVFRMFAFFKGDQGIARVITHVGGSESAGMLLNAKLVLKATGFYAKKLLNPFPLNFGIIHVSDFYVLLGLLVLVVFLWLITRRTLAAFFVICAGAVGTSALIIPMLRFTWTPLAERYMYIPSAFFMIGVTLAVQCWDQRQKYRLHLTILLVCITIIAFYGTGSRNFLWQDNLALFKDTFQKSPDFIPAQNEVANALYEKGRVKEAAIIYKTFNHPNGLINAQYGLKNKALILMNEGKYSDARDILYKLRSNPGKHEISILLQILELNKIQVAANMATSKDVYAESVEILNRIIKLTGDPFYSYRLGIVHMQVGQREKALAAFNVVIQTSPTTAYYRNPSEKLAKELSR